MKTTTFALAAVSLLQLTSAQPHKHRRHAHEQRDVVTVVNTVYAEASNSPQIIVYVDGEGKPVSTETVGSAPVATQPPAAPAAAAPSVAAVKEQVVNANSVSSSAPAQASSAAPAASSGSSSSSGNGFGYSYSPYNGDGTCKTQSQVDQDFAAIPSGYSTVRIYGTDCNQVTTVLSAAKAKGLKLFAGVFDITKLDAELAIIIAAAKGDWSTFSTISVGNELVNAGSTSPSTVVAAIGTARSTLKTAGFTGSVVTVDTLVATLAHPELCDKSDYCAVNSHPFFDGNTVASESGSFLTTQVANLKSKLANKSQQVVICETGWPSAGQSNSKAVPSAENQAAAISSIKAAFKDSPSSVILFNTFNTMWKKNTAAQFEAEQYWGFLGPCPSG